MRHLILIAWICTFAIAVHAQTSGDALRYSYLDLGGTARTVGIGGGIGALGADFSVVSSNPAGLAQFRRSEISITPSLFSSEVSSVLKDGNSDALKDDKKNFNFNNIGIVIHSSPRGKWQTSNFAIGFNRLANFNKRFTYEGVSKGSITDRFLDLATDNNIDRFEEELATETVAIYPVEPGSSDYTSDFEEDRILNMRDPDVMRSQEFRSSGSLNEMVFALAANYENRLMIGATVGVPFLSYDEDKSYMEEDIDSIEFFNSLTFEENLSTDGIGINLKLGLIYRINQMFRVGGAIHTPSRFALTDNFSTRLIYDYTDGQNDGPIEASSPEGTFEYRFKTPWRLIGSAAALFGKNGFVTAEVEWVDYGSSSFKTGSGASNENDDRYLDAVTNEIEDQFSSSLNLRVGGEYAWKLLRLRAGFNLNGSPFAADSELNNAYSFGVGVRERDFYIDLAYKRSQIDETFTPYQVGNSAGQLVANDVTISRFLLTLGFKF